jgi:hypothetical protein
MLMPAGPPALVISGFAELAKISEAEKMAVAKTLTVRPPSLLEGMEGMLISSRLCTCSRHLYVLPLQAL